jgi:hypothetical protein
MTYPPYGADPSQQPGGYPPSYGAPQPPPPYGPPAYGPPSYGPPQPGPPQPGPPQPDPYGAYAGYPPPAPYPPAPPRKSRTGLIIGLVAGGVVLLLCLGLGAVLLIPKLSTGQKTPAGAKAAAQHALDLAASGDYGGFYDLLESSSKAQISRSDFITLGTCIKMSDGITKSHVVLGTATVTGNTARVAASSTDGTTTHVDLVWESGGWRLHSEGGSLNSADLSDALRTLCHK